HDQPPPPISWSTLTPKDAIFQPVEPAEQARARPGSGAPFRVFRGRRPVALNDPWRGNGGYLVRAGDLVHRGAAELSLTVRSTPHSQLRHVRDRAESRGR